ncbi:MAG TPA: glycosyltransferase family 87 protein [Candidatus Baltobacteraceae bacterium]|nr:glycosyltransferase family 87 protein [Candidatus Baltobacteraceae bacterium]
MIEAPLRIGRDRALLYGTALILLCLTQVRFVVAQGFGDWSAFWAAGATAGTMDLLDPQRHAIWQTAHQLPTTIFPYLPAVAWLYFPFKPLSIPAGYAANFLLMSLLAALGAVIAARVYLLRLEFTMLATFAWPPVVAALSTGQNSPLGLAGAMCAVWGIAGESALIAGLSIGLLLYKFTYAVPFIVLCLLRKQWRALGVVFVCAAAWYLASAGATAGDWLWPQHYVAALHGYFAADAQHNAVKAISLPGLLLRAGVAAPLAFCAGAALFAAALPALIRSNLLEAASFAPLVGLAANPHTQPYDAVLALPAIVYFATHAAEPWRTRVVAAIYVLAPLWLLSGVLRFDVLAILCDVPVLLWLLKGYDESTSRPYIGIADSGDRSQA